MRYMAQIRHCTVATLVSVLMLTLFPVSPTRAIIGGVPDVVSNWQVVSLSIGNYACTGSLIDAQWVLTAAHCVVDDSGTSLFAAGSYARAVDPGSGRELWGSMILSATYHPEYKGDTFHNDIALLLLASAIPGPYASFATEEELAAVESFGSTAVASGFGRISNYSNTQSPIPLQVRLPLVSQPDCQRTWPYQESKFFTGFVCTSGSIRATACQGDSGGPLFVEIGGTRKLAGITSFGSPPCGSSYTIFTRAPKYLDWVYGLIRPSSTTRPAAPSPVVQFPSLPPLAPAELTAPPASRPASAAPALPPFTTTRMFQLTLEEQGRFCAVDIDTPLSLRGRVLRIFVNKTKGKPTATRVLDEFGDTRIRLPQICSKVPYGRIYVQLDDSTTKVRTVL